VNQEATPARAELGVSRKSKMAHLRWYICALLFFGTTINYVDRQVLGILAKDLQRAIGWSEFEYGHIVAAFQAAYAIGLLAAGRLMDRFGTRIGYALAITVWSIAAMGHAIARSAFGFGVARFGLGLGEAANFPAAIKTVAEWFPKKERALATGIFNAGTNVGAIVAPLTVPWIALQFGWPWAFILTGAVGFLWLAFWLPFYRRPEEHPRLSEGERAHIQSDPPDPVTKIPWSRLVPHRQTLAFEIGKYMTDPIWWFYLFWTPNFLRQQHGLDLSTVGLPLVAIYLIADVGSIGGGWLSSALIKRGWSINRGRKTAMLICALCVAPIVFASQVRSLWAAVSLIGLAAAAHQGWSANIFTMVSDMFPRRAVGSVVGIGGMAGAMGGVTIAVITGSILELTGSYTPIFIIAGSAYLVALLIIHLLVPRLEPVEELDKGSVRPLSGETILGFGFIGLILGEFVGWCLSLVSTRSLASSQFLIRGAIIGTIIGAAGGVLIGYFTSKRKA
jgi:ACS family hexuronate transporter-like MFS transporter